MAAHEQPINIFKSALERDVSTGIAAIQGLMQVLRQSGAKTLQELIELLKSEAVKFKEVDCSVIAVTSACELFLRFITLAHTQLESQDFATCLTLMLDRGTHFLAKLDVSGEKISQGFQPFLQDGDKVLVHGRSRIVLSALVRAARSGVEFQVYLTRSSGEKLKKRMDAENISCILVEDMGIGYIINQIDCVLLGAEGVCESGGIVNQLGSLPVAIVANKYNKPVYTLVESFKFVRLYPLTQEDIPIEYQYPGGRKDDATCSPRLDYTPPSLLTLLFTDLGILTPSAVSDELINLYL
ncbi:translation initiation factor eIF-2B subunit alpha [Eurytemora carolleeae]|uniref:translation initiation factor eIF-2B subunit alpha n=1 Tax=Eurytemora carolleeae TaxID=1294199 RepID=UPI000C76273E|nr:translation initiation factor eIF-2B subunit alpha [Eurytemora carolleeae]|eukprot:XP_023329412.1 translation initiation factor eIF-2B subunit alpha-like [Eurytemora affinis]